MSNSSKKNHCARQFRKPQVQKLCFFPPKIVFHNWSSFWVQKKFGVWNKFWLWKKFVVRKKIWAWTNFWVWKSLGPKKICRVKKNFQSKICLVQQKIWVKKDFGSKNVFGFKNIFRSKNVLDPNEFWAQIFFSDFFPYSTPPLVLSAIIG